MAQQQQGTNELQAPFTKQFSGLNLSSAVKDLPPEASPVFHNCDISEDGAVVRRGGTQSVVNFDLGGDNRRLAATSIRTRFGSEFAVFVNPSGIDCVLMEDAPGTNLPTWSTLVSKQNVFGVPPTSIRFINCSAPYDRLLMLTPEHPIVQLSVIQRRVQYRVTSVTGGTCTIVEQSGAATGAAFNWNDNIAANYIIRNDDLGVAYTPTAKTTAFDFTLGVALTLNSTFSATVTQITWQWWAESLVWEGADFQQQVSRFNVSDVDQSVKIPDRIRTDLNPVYRNSHEVGIFLLSGTAPATNTYTFMATRTPVTENEWGLSNGSRYIPGANREMAVSPFFTTFGARQAAGGIGTVVFNRRRELRFNGGRGVAGVNLDVWLDNDQQVLGIGTGWFLSIETFTATERVLTNAVNQTTRAQYIAFFRDPSMAVSYSSTVYITSVEASTLFGSAVRRNYMFSLATLGGAIDGTYVRAYGIGQFVDYSRRNFHSEGALYRGRLLLRNPTGSNDQLVLSEVNDETVPGDFYQYFQVTDALLGAAADPFTINITNDARESITAIVGWQQTVFVFTNSTTYGISSGEQFSDRNYNVSLISSYGAFNGNCVVVTNLTLLFMNRYGVFDLLNKPNTSEYGAVERSVNIRPLFNSDIVSSQFDNSHWLHYNEATSRLFVGLAIGGDRITTTRNLLLNLTWDAWATIGSAEPFNLQCPFQLFSYTMLIASLHPSNRFYSALCYGMSHHLDYAYSPVVAAYPFNVRFPLMTSNVTADSRGILQTLQPLTPGLNDILSGDPTTKVYDTLQRNDRQPTLTQTQAVNPAADFGLFNTTTSMAATVATGQLFTGYPNLQLSGAAIPFQYRLTAPVGFTASGSNQLTGVLYNSLYSSPVFDLDSLGRLKRLKRLHLIFDTSVNRRLRYAEHPGVNIRNAAFVGVVMNYREQRTVTEPIVVTDGQESRGTLQCTVPLQGYGCDYQVYVSSVGAETFKLAAYEIEATPAAAKRYVRQ